jgi:hypothetical protein
MDCEEVRPLDEREAADPERGHQQKLAAIRPERVTPGEGDDQREPEECSRRAHLGEPLGREARLLDHLRDDAVEREEQRGRDHHRVAERRARLVRLVGNAEDRLGHGRPNLADAGAKL